MVSPQTSIMSATPLSARLAPHGTNLFYHQNLTLESGGGLGCFIGGNGKSLFNTTSPRQIAPAGYVVANQLHTMGMQRRVPQGGVPGPRGLVDGSIGNGMRAIENDVAGIVVDIAFFTNAVYVADTTG